jgi:glycosyltransferase involved in cell wall biosynthesis
MPSTRKVYSIYHGRFPGERAATLFAAKEAESFADAGTETVLLVPRRRGREKGDPYEYFHVKKNFTIIYLPTIDLFGIPILNALAFWTSFITFGLATYLHLLRHASREDLVYSNESFPLLLSTLSFQNTMVAVHDFPEKKDSYYGLLFRRVKRILSTNHWKKEALIKKFGLSSEKIVVIPNAVDVAEFAIGMSKEEARKKLGLDPKTTYVVYTGHLYAWKGVDTLAEAATLLPEGIEVLFVGGREDDIESFKKRHHDVKNIRLVGFRPHEEIPLWQCAADVLVLPNTAKEEISAHYTSPMKLFEYMASGRPIVASRISSITEVLGEDDATLVAPDEPQALSRGIVTALTREATVHPRLSEYSWQHRAKRLFSSI